MAKKLSKIGEMFQRVKDAASGVKSGKTRAEEMEERLAELEDELDQNIIYVDDDGNETGPQDPYGITHQPAPKAKQSSPQQDHNKALADMLAKMLLLQKLLGSQSGKTPSSIKNDIMKKLMEDYIQGQIDPNASQSDQMEQAFKKRQEFDDKFAGKLAGLLTGGFGKLGSGLHQNMQYQEEEEQYDGNMQKGILEKKTKSKEERGLQRIVRSILSDNKFDRFIGRKTRGKLDTNGLHRFPTNGRIFGQKEERKGKHYTATILVDLSSSMSDSITFASPAAMRFHQLLSEIIPTQVRGYNVSFHKFVEFEDKLTKKEVETVAKKMVATASDGRHSLGCIAQVGLLPNGKPKYGLMNLPLSPEHKRIVESYGNNYTDKQFDTRGTLDGTAIRTLADQLSAKPGKHIVIVMNDGSPGQSWRDDVYTWQDGFKTPYTNANLDLKKAVEYAQKRGIMFVGIGIFSDSVEEYYPKKFCTVIEDRDDLATAFDGASKQLLRYVHRG